jgi:hypothetical protein
VASGLTAFDVFITLSLPFSSTSHAQPLPNCARAASANLMLQFVEAAEA